MFSDTWKGFTGPVVQLSESSGGTSGRFEVASIIARVFPSHTAFTAKVIAEGIVTAADFPFGPYPHDNLRYRSNEIVEYETPPQTEGLGTRSRLQKSDVAIKGVEMLSGADVDLTSLAVRLPLGSEDLIRAIVRQVEQAATAGSTR